MLNQPVWLLSTYNVSQSATNRFYSHYLFSVDPPLILSITSPDPVPRSESVSITCEYDGNPDPMVSWVQGMMDPLDDSSDDVTITTTSTMSTLTLSNVQTSDAGDYRCITNNTIGSGNIEGSDGAYASDAVTVVVQGEGGREGGRETKIDAISVLFSITTCLQC